MQTNYDYFLQTLILVRKMVSYMKHSEIDDIYFEANRYDYVMNYSPNIDLIK